MTKILCDNSEPQPLIERLTELCEKKGIIAEYRELREHPNARTDTLIKNPFMNSGIDYIVIDNNGKALLGIERKTLRDLVLSMLQRKNNGERRLFAQLDNLRKFPMSILLLEGYLPPKYTRFETHVYGLEFWCYRNGVGVVHTSGIMGSARAILVLAKKTLGLS